MKEIFLQAIREYLMPVVAFQAGIIIICAGMGAAIGAMLKALSYFLQ